MIMYPDMVNNNRSAHDNRNNIINAIHNTNTNKPMSWDINVMTEAHCNIHDKLRDNIHGKLHCKLHDKLHGKLHGSAHDNVYGMVKTISTTP
eukprot:224693-Heterocapsa_arctica.AAC.1